ncbi:radical SAM protein [Desulfatitalea tepidiphila]|uniref:radical SAM protein n=1 Tax=Desulfatitalea tepidiphila TaxID=1185843 RepID=UPI0006B5EB55|nr:radical SAM protein [Desulfatitalea tepidiphila]
MDTDTSLEFKKKNSEDDDVKDIVEDIVNSSQTQSADSVIDGAPENSEDPVVNEAFEHLKAIFVRHFHDAMMEAGRYIIEKFYGNDYRVAFAKNKTKDEPASLKALIDKIRMAPKATENGVPSIGWFYNAVNLAAHEEICAQEGLQTFGMLGHSHKLQLLHTPKIKSIQPDEFDEAVKSAFAEKERLAKHAYDNSLSVREFKNYIKEQDSSDGIDITCLPPKPELRKIEPKELLKLWNKASAKYEDGQRQAKVYKEVLASLEMVLNEIGSNPAAGKGRFQDWTESKNNFNICVGCKNDCVYCYMKDMNVGRQKKKQPEDWSNWEIRQQKVDAPQNLRNGLVGFPSSHDIFPEILDPYLFVLGKMLRAGNEVLVVTKPNLACISTICAVSQFFKDKIIFRFTIGAMNDAILKIWEPNAPSYEERKACLECAFKQGFRTSISMEPPLDVPNIPKLIEDVRPFVNNDIWLGTMNHIDSIRKWADESFSKEIERIKNEQSPEILQSIYEKYKDDALIKWKTDAVKIFQGNQNQIEKTKRTQKRGS